MNKKDNSTNSVYEAFANDHFYYFREYLSLANCIKLTKPNETVRLIDSCPLKPVPVLSPALTHNSAID
jgi:hypothetical protein